MLILVLSSSSHCPRSLIFLVLSLSSSSRYPYILILSLSSSYQAEHVQHPQFVLDDKTKNRYFRYFTLHKQDHSQMADSKQSYTANWSSSKSLVGVPLLGQDLRGELHTNPPRAGPRNLTPRIISSPPHQPHQCGLRS